MLSPELETLLVRQLNREWYSLNRVQLKGALRPPVLQLGDIAPLGTWQGKTRTITLQRHFASTAPWGAVMEVLAHETAHQFAAEVYGATAEKPHGPGFQEACRRLGIGAVASGPVQGTEAEEPAVLRRVRKLLALAASPNQHEAEAAMEKAHRLLREHELSLGDARGDRTYVYKRIGAVRTKFSTWETQLGALLGAHFHVEAIRVQTYEQQAGAEGHVLELIGTPDNVTFAAYVYDFLAETAARLWAAHKRAHGIRGDRDRRTFLVGVILGFSDKLAKAERTYAETGLVWVGDAGLDHAFHARHPSVRTRRASVNVNESFHAGNAAGQTIVLHKPVEAKAGGGGKLLTGG